MRTSRINVTDIRKSNINVALRQIKGEGCVTHNPIASIGSQTGITADHRSGPRRIAECRRCSGGITKRVRPTGNSASQIHSIDNRIHGYCKNAMVKPAAESLEVRYDSGLFIASLHVDHLDAPKTVKELMVVRRIRKLKIKQRNIKQPVAAIIGLTESAPHTVRMRSP